MTNDGNAILTAGPAFFSNSNGDYDYFISKINPDGQVIWGKKLCFSCLGDFDTQFGDQLIADNGDFIIVGSVNPDNGPGIDSDDIFLARIYPDGNILWTRTYNLNIGFLDPDEKAHRIIQLPNGELMVCSQKKGQTKASDLPE